MKKILLLYLFFFMTTIVYSYENDYFSINLPEDYIEKINDNVYTWSKDNIFLNIVININKDNYDVNKFEQKDLDKQKQYIIDTYQNELSTYNVVPTISNMNVINNDSISYLEYDLMFESTSTIGHDIYQKCRLYTSNNYVYLLTYNSENEINEDDINIINSFKIKDQYLKNINYTIYIILFILMGAFILLIDYLISKKRHK